MMQLVKTVMLDVALVANMKKQKREDGRKNRVYVMDDVDLHCCDCLEYLVNVPSESIDLIFTDPPFNIGKCYGGKSSNDRRDDYYLWCYDWIKECFRVLKPTGSFYLMTIARHVFKLGYEMERYGVFVNKIEWRNVSACHSKRGFWPSTQPILLFGKTHDYIFNTYGETRAIAQNNLRWGGYSTGPKGQLLDYWNDIPFVYAGSIAHKEAVLKPGTNEKVHPCQMPTGISTRAILFSTNKDGIVLDPFMGSGTVGVSCVNLERNFIGCEKEKEYCELAKSRIDKAQNQMRLGI